MMHSLLRTIGLGMLCMMALCTPLHSAFAQDSVQPGCLSAVYNRIDYEDRLWRSVVFGQPKAADAPLGSVRRDSAYRQWIKRAQDAWVWSADEDTTIDDATMDDESDVSARRGLLAVRTADTSELLPPLIQSARALRCRLYSVCATARASTDATEPVVSVAVDGCREMEMPVLEACAEASPRVLTAVRGCDAIAEDTFSRNEALLELAVTYDAAYRSLAQFEGIFEGFLTDVRFPLLQPLWQTVRTLGAIDNLPCFLAQCDE